MSKCGKLEILKYPVANFVHLVGGLLLLLPGIYLLHMFITSFNDPVVGGSIGPVGMVGVFLFSVGSRLLFKYYKATKLKIFGFRCASCDFQWKQKEGDTYVGVESHLQDLSHKDSSVRVEAVEALGQFGGTQEIESLIQALNDEDLNVRKKAAEALGNIGDENAVEAITQSVDGKKMKNYILDVLAKIGDEKATGYILQAAKDNSITIRGDAYEALKKIKNNKAVDSLIRALDDENKYVRTFASIALGNIGGDRAREALNKAIKDKSFRVRRFAKMALNKIQLK